MLTGMHSQARHMHTHTNILSLSLCLSFSRTYTLPHTQALSHRVANTHTHKHTHTNTHTQALYSPPPHAPSLSEPRLPWRLCLINNEDDVSPLSANPTVSQTRRGRGESEGEI